MSLPNSLDVLVIGAGPAGCIAASLLHKAGLRVAVFERDTFPRFVIGESLLPRCMDHMDEAGLLDDVKARNYIVKIGAGILRGSERAFFNFEEQFTPGWSWTWQVPRADFDQTLALGVAKKGIPVLHRHTVTAFQPGTHPRTTVVDDTGATQVVESRFVLDASGYGRVLPRLLDLELPSEQPVRQALFSHVTGDLRPAGAEEGRIWVCVHEDCGWIWIIPFSNGLTSVGAVGEPPIFEKHRGVDDEDTLRRIFATEPNARDRLKEMKLTFSPRWIRGYSVSVKRLWGEGFCLAGNATEFLDPVFSSGVTLAMESASRAAKLTIRQLAGEQVDWERDYTDYMMLGINTFRAAVNGWYDGRLHKIFFFPAQPPTLRRQITSMLAGYVWDERNPFVAEQEGAVTQLAARVDAVMAHSRAMNP